MKKKLVLVLVTALVAISVFAQDVTLATLQQGEITQLFYGSDGFLKALDAANDGDVITLSAGTFNVGTITKAVKVFGAGYTLNVDKGLYPTVLSGGMHIDLSEDKEGLLLEGFYSDYSILTIGKLTAFTFRKLRLNSLALNRGQTKNGLIDQCRLLNDVTPDASSDNLRITNSVIGHISPNGVNAVLTVENCIFSTSQSTTALFRNNRITAVHGSYTDDASLGGSCKAYNNCFKKGSASIPIQSGNTTVDDITLFGKEIANYSDLETYELTTSAKTTYLGTDGTQIGIYGGSSPFTITPSNPQIVLKKIDQKSTSDGKLNVSFKVEAQKN